MKISVCLPQEKSRGFCFQAAKEYEKRLSRYCELVPVTGTSLKKPADFRIGISSLGIGMSSEEMAARLSALAIQNRRVWFFFGSKEEGLDELWLLSGIVFKPDLQYVVLLEQIYRSFKIISGEPYHK
ncbi:MAG: 23S rRNA (pseudouridine(1915)-N(3))-methyltransferase RlmH [Clostridiales bacterium]|jgi:23S rRNA (pseudouridine1915-N3)-methyltransferase|nr:23S rRNA (pseudouridine(1915)-N(3))-methyltransferase RlmH [Clostridiales bacterium]